MLHALDMVKNRIDNINPRSVTYRAALEKHWPVYRRFYGSIGIRPINLLLGLHPE
jgi:hypothetical protein